MSPRQHWAAIGGLFLFGLVLHTVLALLVSAPPQWDSAYAWEVGRNIASGEGAVTRAVWALAWLPPGVEHTADLHWMPLPSRILVPALWLFPGWRGAQIIPVVVAAMWGPMGLLWARRIGLDGALAWAAGALSATGLGAMAFLSVPDSVGLFGILGSGALLAAADRRVIACMALAGLAALTRGDGFWVGLACAVALPGLRAIGPALVGMGMTAAWNLRNYAVAGEGFVALRARIASAGATGDLLLLDLPGAGGWMERIGSAVTTWPLGGVLFVMECGLLPLVFALVCLWRRRDDRGVWPLALLPVLVLVGDPLLAPGVAGQGTMWRTLAAVLPAVAALGLAGSTQVLRGLPPALLPSLVAIAGIGLSAPLGFKLHLPFAIVEDCAVLDEAGVPLQAPVLSTDAIQVAARCDRPAVQIPPVDTVEAVPVLSERYDIQWMVGAPDDHRVEAWRPDALDEVGWERVSARVWRRAPTVRFAP